jgi:polysaccharide biosynthesis/export protein
MVDRLFSLIPAVRSNGLMQLCTVLFCALLLFVSPAGAQPPRPPDAPKAKPEPAKPEPNRPDVSVAAPVDPKKYLIGPEDILTIRVWREAELSGSVAVRPDGKITMPLIGELQAGGVTPEQLQTKITESLSNYINSPQVMVSVQAVLSKKYYITGEVGQTGSFSLVTPTTVLEALSKAGGFRDYAQVKKIVVMRGNKRLKFNYKDVIAGKNMDQNVYLEDGDHIIVP